MADSGGWSTIESDEGVFTSLIEQLGVQDVQFEEIVALHAESISALSPVYGVIFLFKYIGASPSDSRSRPEDGRYDTTAVEDQGLFFATQTIQNACGTQAILSVILNNETSSTASSASTSTITIGPSLSEFRDFTTGFPADLRGEALSNSQMIREAHNSFARSSPFADETQRDPQAASEDVFHFIGYTVHHDVLYELDGLHPYPINHGSCTAEEFPNKIIPVLRRRILRYPAEEVRFNLMAVCGDLLKKAEAFGDPEMIEREKLKRDQWEFENSLRRHNFVGFTGEVMKGVVAMMLEEGDEEYNEWVKGAQRKTRSRLKTRRAKGQE